jgi:hypothetical protein
MEDEMKRKNIIQTRAFNEAIRQVLGIEDLIPSPDLVISALVSNLGPNLEAVHRAIKSSRPGRVANECAREMKRTLDAGATAEEMGFGPLSNPEMIASEWSCWFEEETHIDLKEEEYRLEELELEEAP